MTAQSQTVATLDTEGLDPNSLAAIRALLAAEPEVKPQPVEERKAAKAQEAIAPVEQVESVSSVRRPVRVQQNAARPAPRPIAPDRDASRATPATETTASRGVLARAKTRVLGYRPKPKHIILASLGLLIFFRPWLVLGLLFLAGFVVTGIFLILGYDGFWHRAMSVARWYARRRPARSVALHRKLDRFAMKWDAVLDRFPEGSVDGLYLPDFGDLAEADARHDAALDRRYDSLRENEA